MKQGWEFNLNSESVFYERLGYKKYRVVLSYKEDKFLYGTTPSDIILYINSIIVNDENLDVPWDKVDVDLEYMNSSSLSIILDSVFELEGDDNFKLLFHFDVDKREGIINNLLNE